MIALHSRQLINGMLIPFERSKSDFKNVVLNEMDDLK